MRYLSSYLTVALAAGIGAGVAIDARVTLFVTLLMSAAWAAVWLAYARGYARVQLAALLLLAASIGWTLGTHAVDRAVHSPLRTVLEQRLGGFAVDSVDRRFDEPLLVEGRLVGDALVDGDGVVLRLSVARVWINGVAVAASGGISVGVSGQQQADHLLEWRAGRVIRARTLLRRPARYLNEGLADQERTLARRGISLVGTIKSASIVEVVERGRWWEELAASLRARTRAALARHVRPLGGQSSAVATAILIGDRAGLSEQTQRRLQEAGTYHVIAISGGNIAILAGLLLGAMALAGMRGRGAALVAIAALVAYAVVAAGGSSVLRATLMAVVYLAVRLIDQRTAPANAISLTAAAVLLVNPLAIADVGFWFTFGATVALVVAADATKDTKGTKDTTVLFQYAARSAVLVLGGTVAVEIALAPVAAYVFQRVTVAGLLLNFVALPAMTVVQVAAMGVVVADLAGLAALAGWLGEGVHLASMVLVESARVLDVAPWLSWRVPSPHEWVLAAYYACVIGAFWFAPGRVVAALLLLWIMAAPHARVRAHGDGRLHVSMLDVGQGDAILVTFPNGRHLLVDTGGVPVGTFDIGERVIGPALRARNILALDYLAVTHGDADHAGGARAVLRDFSPREVWWGIPVHGHAGTEAVREEAGRQRAAWRTLQRGDKLHIGGVDLYVHHPPPEDWERQRIRNNDSLVLELRFQQVSLLLTGDIAREVEEALIPSLAPASTVVLKVAHHGSPTSSAHDFLAAARPAVALIGVGRGNPYGHPAPYVLGRLHDAGAEVFRTDLDGQINLVVDGRSVWGRTHAGRTFCTDGSQDGHEGHEGHEGH